MFTFSTRSKNHWQYTVWPT